jgi:hypothetical protein
MVPLKAFRLFGGPESECTSRDLRIQVIEKP